MDLLQINNISFIKLYNSSFGAIQLLLDQHLAMLYSFKYTKEVIFRKNR